MVGIEPLKQSMISPLPLNEKIVWRDSVPDESAPLQSGLRSMICQERLALQPMKIKFGEREVHHLEQRGSGNPTPRDILVHRVRNARGLERPTNHTIQARSPDNLTFVLDQPRITIARFPRCHPALDHLALCVHREIRIRPQRLAGREMLPVSGDEFQEFSSVTHLRDHQGDDSPVLPAPFAISPRYHFLCGR